VKSCLPGKTFIKKVRSKVELKKTGHGQNKKILGRGSWPNFWGGGSKILGGEENPAFPGKLALGKKPCSNSHFNRTPYIVHQS
jgi:hypothetical protein